MASPPKSPSPRREGDLVSFPLSPSLPGGGVWGEVNCQGIEDEVVNKKRDLPRSLYNK